ncbi:hypothetical protein FACS1894164_20920 [Spirochaetia bacterium]|nr:hypothetical protein FACS1894164_20920 [Spirochaetia bacterium]
MPGKLTILMIGDVVGDPGLAAVEESLPAIIREKSADFVVVNAENAAEGFGMTSEIAHRIRNAGADVITSGNHIWEKKELMPLLDSEAWILRPANYPAAATGHGFVTIEKNGMQWLVINLQGREFMTPIDCPFQCFDSLFEQRSGNPIIVVDFHAESTVEKEALGWYLDGRAHIVAGTHTHVQTADEKILKQGSAYITDLGMTGVQDAIIGMDTGICIERIKKQIPYSMKCASGAGIIRGISVTIDSETGKTLLIERI